MHNKNNIRSEAPAISVNFQQIYVNNSIQRQNALEFVIRISSPIFK